MFGSWLCSLSVYGHCIVIQHQPIQFQISVKKWLDLFLQEIHIHSALVSYHDDEEEVEGTGECSEQDEEVQI